MAFIRAFDPQDDYPVVLAGRVRPDTGQSPGRADIREVRIQVTGIRASGRLPVATVSSFGPGQVLKSRRDETQLVSLRVDHPKHSTRAIHAGGHPSLFLVRGQISLC